MTLTFSFDVLTLEGKVFSGKVQYLTVPGEKGSFGVLANHAELVSACVPGILRVRESAGSERTFKTGLGFFEVAKNRAVLLVESAEPFSTAS